MVLSNVVIAALELYQLIGFLLYAIQIEVAVRIRAVFDNHLTVSVEGVITRQEISSGEYVFS